MPRRILRAVMGLLALAAGARALTGQEVLELSLKQAVELALAPDGATRTQLAREAVDAAMARQRQSLAALLPNVDGTMAYADQTRNLRTFGLNFSIPGVGALPSLAGPFSVYDLRATVTQSVFDLSAIKRYQAGRRGADQARAEVDAAAAQTIERVARAYLAALAAQANVESAEANVDLSEAIVKLTRSQKNAGTGTGIEVTRAQVQLANEQQRLLVARNELARAQLRLLREAGIPMRDKIRLTDKLAYQMVDLTTAPAPDRADLKAQQARETAVRASYEAVKWERLPTVVASGDYGTTGPSVNNSIPTRSVGVALRLPVFDGGRRDARRVETGAALRAEQIRTRDLQQQIQLELRLAVDGVRAADSQLKAAEQGAQLAQTEVEQARRRYEAGVSNSLELTDAQTRLVRARDNYLAALFSHNAARLDYTAALGTISRTIR
ncbi:MAG: TolC family protein [Acidobacteria bacterium]|nr:TolC family protein [Acidobacteriota bacterium]